MGGTIQAESVVGRGSVFTVRLTLDWRAHPTSKAIHDFDTSEGVPRGLRILLAEDNVVNQKVILALLEKMGCSVDVAANGRIAIEKVQTATHDLILMDCQMPEVDGLSATRKIREYEALRCVLDPTPIVAITANAMNHDREQCIAAGMDDFLPKPIHLVELQRVLHTHARRASRQ